MQNIYASRQKRRRKDIANILLSTSLIAGLGVTTFYLIRSNRQDALKKFTEAALFACWDDMRANQVNIKSEGKIRLPVPLPVRWVEKDGRKFVIAFTGYLADEEGRYGTYEKGSSTSFPMKAVAMQVNGDFVPDDNASPSDRNYDLISMIDGEHTLRLRPMRMMIKPSVEMLLNIKDAMVWVYNEIFRPVVEVQGEFILNPRQTVAPGMDNIAYPQFENLPLSQLSERPKPGG